MDKEDVLLNLNAAKDLFKEWTKRDPDMNRPADRIMFLAIFNKLSE